MGSPFLVPYFCFLSEGGTKARRGIPPGFRPFCFLQNLSSEGVPFCLPADEMLLWAEASACLKYQEARVESKLGQALLFSK